MNTINEKQIKLGDSFRINFGAYLLMEAASLFILHRVTSWGLGRLGKVNMHEKM